MINIYLTDKVEIIKIERDEWGKETRTTQTVNARIENTNRIFTDIEGQEVRGGTLVVLDSKADIQYHYKIRLKEVNGSVNQQQSDKEFLPRKITRWSNFLDEHLEVIL